MMCFGMEIKPSMYHYSFCDALNQLFMHFYIFYIYLLLRLD